MPLIPTQTVAIDGRTVEFALAGEGGQAMVLVNGSGGHLDGWFRIFEPLAADGLVLAYNRPGIGRSSPSPEPQTASTCARDAFALVGALGIAGPILAVGHSFGGLIVNYLARCSPDRVAGVVLLDASTSDDIRESAELQLSPGLLNRIGNIFAARNPHSELEHAIASADETDKAGPFPPVPLSVVSGAKSAKGPFVPQAYREGRSHNQQALAALSPLGRHVIAWKSGHFPQMSEPKLVIDVIAAMRRQLRVAAAA